MKDKEFGLLGGLFSSTAVSTKSAASDVISDIDEKNTKEKETKRTWKIKDELWEDFVILVSISGLTQAEFVNNLISDAIEKDCEKILNYKDFIKKLK